MENIFIEFYSKFIFVQGFASSMNYWASLATTRRIHLWNCWNVVCTPSGVPNRGAGLLIYFSFFADLTLAYLALPFYFFRGCLAACAKFQVWRANWNHKPCEFWLFYLPFMCTLAFVFCTYCSCYSHTAWQKPIFTENRCFCKWLNKK